MPNNNPVLWSKPADPDVCAEVAGEVDHLFSESRCEEALHLLESTWPGLPAEAPHMSHIDLMVIRAYLQAQVGRESDALETIEAMLRSDVSCNLAGRGFDPLRTHERYADVAQRNEALLAREREGASVEFDVHLPSDLRSGPADARVARRTRQPDEDPTRLAVGPDHRARGHRRLSPIVTTLVHQSLCLVGGSSGRTI